MPATWNKPRRADAVFCAAILAVSLVFLAQAWRLPASRFDPLGPGSFPIAICLLLALLSALGLALTLFGRSLGEAETAMILGINDADGTGRRRPWLAIGVFAATALYAGILQWTPLGFFWATAAFVTATGIAMGARTPRKAAIAIGVGLGVSGLLTLVFGRLLALALP